MRKKVLNLLPGEVQNVLSDGCHVVAGNDVMHQEVRAKHLNLKVHKIENFLGSEFEFCSISFLVLLNC